MTSVRSCTSLLGLLLIFEKPYPRQSVGSLVHRRRPGSPPVSEEVAIEMAEGAIVKSLAHYSVAVTGIAGPGGATENKPVGLVYIATCRRGSWAQARKFVFDGDRAQIRSQTVTEALKLLISEVSVPQP